MSKNVLLCNGGGPTAVINLTNMGVCEGCLDYSLGQVKIFAAIGGTGALIGDHATADGRRAVARLDEYLADNHRRQLIKHAPSTWIGSGRYKLGAEVPESISGGDRKKAIQHDCQRIIEVCDRLEIGHVFFVGGDDTLSTVNDLVAYTQEHQKRTEWPTFLSVPKTIDNDLPDEVDVPEGFDEPWGTLLANGRIQAVDACPGFGTAASFVANEVTHLAVEARALSRHYIIELMGRNSGFLTAASLLACEFGYGPHLIAVPEHGPFDVNAFVHFVAARERDEGYGVYCVSEGILGPDGKIALASGENEDLFGHKRLGGVGELLTALSGDHLTMHKMHGDVRAIKLGELQRVSSPFRSRADSEIAYNVGHRAAYWALERGQTGKLVTIARQESVLPTWMYGLVDTKLVSGKNRKLRPQWVTTEEAEGFQIPTIDESYLDYLRALTDPMVPVAPPFERSLLVDL